MHLRVAVTVADIVLLWLVLAAFVVILTQKLQHIANTLGQIDGGVVAIANDTQILDAGADAINSNLATAAGNLTNAVRFAQALGGG